jgi:hypothetical protein
MRMEGMGDISKNLFIFAFLRGAVVLFLSLSTFLFIHPSTTQGHVSNCFVWQLHGYLCITNYRSIRCILDEQLVEGGLLFRRPLPRQAGVVPERRHRAAGARVCSPSSTISSSAAATGMGPVLRGGARRRRVAVRAHADQTGREFSCSLREAARCFCAPSAGRAPLFSFPLRVDGE